MTWRALAALLVVAVLGLVLGAVALERQESRRLFDDLVAEAQLVVDAAVEPGLDRTDPVGDLRAGPHHDRVLAAVDHLVEKGRVVGVQVLGPDGAVLLSDHSDGDPLSADELALLDAVTTRGPQVVFERDEGREPTATVLVRPDVLPVDSGVVVEVLLAQDTVAAALRDTARRLYGASGALVVVMVLVVVGVRRRAVAREHESLHDPLTGLGNRALLGRAAGDLLRRRGPAHEQSALLVLDLDGFKLVNDSLGHAVGDRLLELVARALAGAVRPGDTVVRLGGDEFAVLASRLPTTEAALVVADSVERAVRQPFDVDGVSLEVGVSVGVAVSPADGDDLGTLLRRADVAMYQAKRDGGGSRRYDEAADPHDADQLRLLSDLRTAITEGQLRLYFQPKVAVRESRTVAFEALVRWEHPAHGLLQPAQFVPLAERTALMRPLTWWVLREAVRRCADWQAAGHDVGVAVNISPQTLLDPDLPLTVVDLLAETGLSGSLLELEITETAVMAEPERALDTLRRLQALGVSVAIDDFGAGYTSLSYLKTLPVNSLKIDRRFVTHLLEDARDEAVARSVVMLGHDLGMTVVAEGVETPGVRDRLRELGCDEVQGFLLARPMAADEVDGWLLDQVGPAAVTRDADVATAG
ncbi:putative bifunctional diguanylate cyclase/phosphodiesterase [Aquipuribacter sp. SD81]|uniref:putative bifunctional diguanylate cyclase/phosphodiesterase n=1 Tax=Aquipuribacter sp. SD81 TaxID=3127703 RepID=UPI0030187EAD